MKNDKMILIGAVLFAGALVAQKTGVLGKMFPAAKQRFSVAGFQHEDSPFIGYNPSNPGAYVTVDDLINDAAGGGEWMTIPTFGQSGDSALGWGGLVNKPTWAP